MNPELKIFGHQLIQEMLTQSVHRGRIHHALLFHGPPGIGKFSLAINFARFLMCKNNIHDACGECDVCRRIQLPFPFHPDLHIFREIGAQLVFDRHAMVARYLSEDRFNVDRIQEATSSYLRAIETLKDKGYFTHVRPVQGCLRDMDIVKLNPEGAYSSRQAGQLEQDPFLIWMLQKCALYQSRSTYQKSVKIEQIRQLQKDLSFQPFESALKVAIIDDADNILEPAQNSLLKTLEEPPGNAVLILVTSNLSALIPTVRSRCQSIPFYHLRIKEISDGLVEKFQFTREYAESVARKSEGRMSMALLSEWDRQTQLESNYAKIFSGDPPSPNYWAILAASMVLGDKDSGQQEIGLNDFMIWMHDAILREATASSGQDVMLLPGGKPATLGHLTKLFDDLQQLHRIQRFSPDLRLHLETIFLKLNDFPGE